MKRQTLGKYKDFCLSWPIQQTSKPTGEKIEETKLTKENREVLNSNLLDVGTKKGGGFVRLD